MIVFDLECSKGHRFEGWFESLPSFEEQHRKKLVCCPYCDDTSVKRVMSPIAVKKRSGQEPTPTQGQGEIDYQRLAKEIVDYVHKNFEDVGAEFASEALKMHYGVTEKRNIRGSATEQEEKILRQEGIEFFKLPMPKDEDKN